MLLARDVTKDQVGCIPRVLIVVMTAIAIVSTLAATSLTSVEDRPIAVEWPYMRLAKWNNGALINVEYDHTVNPLVWLFEGQVQQTVPFTIPGARSMEIYDWDRAADGTIGWDPARSSVSPIPNGCPSTAGRRSAAPEKGARRFENVAVVT